MDIAMETKRTFSFVEFVTGTAIFVGAVLTSFIWIPLVAAAAAIAALLAAGIWVTRKVWAWYDSCYSSEMDASGRYHSYIRVMTGIGRPSRGMMGGRESDRIVPPRVVPLFSNNKSTKPESFAEEDASKPVNGDFWEWEENEKTKRLSYGA